MFINVYTISIFFSISFLVAVIELVRKNKLQERYSILWIVMSMVIFILSTSPVFINTIAKWTDVKNPPSLFFLLGLVYLLIYNLHITTVVSKQSEKITRLAQEISLLRHSAAQDEMKAREKTKVYDKINNREKVKVYDKNNSQVTAEGYDKNIGREVSNPASQGENRIL